MLMTRKLEGKMILETLNSTLIQLRYIQSTIANQNQNWSFLEIVSILETEFRGSFKDLKDQILNVKSHPEIMLTFYAYSLTKEKR